MANDSRIVLNQLVRSGIWSSPGNIQRFKRVILDVDSAITFLYQYCASKHVRRQKSLIGNDNNRSTDYYSATIVNYREFSLYIEQLLEFFSSRKVELILVYRGKPIEAPIFGSLPAQFKKNTQRVQEPLKLLINYDNVGPKAVEEHKLRPWRPNLALNIFKSIVNSKQGKELKIKAHQAFYSSYPTMAKLARDFKCPVLTNDGEFIIMDVRAGFVLFEDFWRTHLESTNVVARHQSAGSVGSQIRSPKSAAVTSSNSLFSSRSGNQAIRFNYNLKFLRQHPGLNAQLGLQLFPLTSGELITAHGLDLMNLKIYNRQYKDKDLITFVYNRENQISKYHMAAARLEQVISFLSAKNAEILNNLFRSEANKNKSHLDDDIRGLFNYYAVSYEFKKRLKFILKNGLDASSANYIEICLVNRESSADYLLTLLCCSVGRLASLDYNRSLQFEDLKTKKSAHSMLDRSKCVLMSILSGNKTFKSEFSALVKRRETLHKRYNMASLTVIDREQSKMIEREIKTATHADAQLDGLRSRINLELIARKNAIKQDSLALVSLSFRSADINKLSAKHQSLLNRHSIKSDHSIMSELTIILALLRYCLETASVGDDYFKQNYLGLGQHFETAILNHYLYTHQVSSRSGTTRELGQLMDLIHRHDFENVAALSPAQPPSGDQSKRDESKKTKAVKQSSSTDLLSRSSQRVKRLKSSASNTSSVVESKVEEQQRDRSPVSKQIRHLIELLNSSLEAYIELNAFLNYPAPKLSLNLHYNPILLYNLTQFSYNNPASKAIIK